MASGGQRHRWDRMGQHHKQLSISMPFGGFKDSGIGREDGIGSMRLFQQAESIYFGLAGGPAGAWE
jgi:acyl-CoA reductase-like NAD-dependent aldehyde dehydrogenase